MAFTLLPPILIVAGLVATLVVLIRRVPQTASLKGQELAKAKKALADLEANPTRFRRVLRALGRLTKLAGAGLKNAGSFLSEKVFKRLASSQAFTGFFTKIFARLHRMRTQQAQPKPVVSSPVIPAQEVQQPTQQALIAEKQEHEAAMEVSRLEKEARHALLMNNLAAAEKLYIEMVSKDAKAIEAYRGLAEVYEKQGNHRDMKASLEQVLKLDKHDSEAKKQLEKLAEAEAVA